MEKASLDVGLLSSSDSLLNAALQCELVFLTFLDPSQPSVRTL